MERYTAAGIKYYVNPRTQQAHWSPPKARRRGASNGEDRTGPRGGGEINSGSGQGRTARVGDSSMSAHSGLPPGWEKRTAPNGRDYFVNHQHRYVKEVGVDYTLRHVQTPPPVSSRYCCQSSFGNRTPLEPRRMSTALDPHKLFEVSYCRAALRVSPLVTMFPVVLLVPRFLFPALLGP